MTIMREWTGREVMEEGERLEREAATTLGFFIFEFSRLEMELGQFLCGKDDHSLQIKKISGLAFKDRLKCMEETYEERCRGNSDALADCVSWLEDAQSMRELRNNFFHGRWGRETTRANMINVIGLPASPDQTSKRYTLRDLESALGSVRHLRKRLSKLGQKAS